MIAYFVSYLVLRFFCETVEQLVLGLFKWIGGARFGSSL